MYSEKIICWSFSCWKSFSRCVVGNLFFYILHEFTLYCSRKMTICWKKAGGEKCRGKHDERNKCIENEMDESPRANELRCQNFQFAWKMFKRHFFFHCSLSTLTCCNQKFNDIHITQLIVSNKFYTKKTKVFDAQYENTKSK